MPAAGTISIKSVAKIAAAAAAAGIAPAALYRAARLDPRLLADADARIPYRQVVDLYAQAARLTGDDAFGLHLAETISPKVFDVVGYVLINSPTLGDAMRRLVRYQAIWNDGAAYHLEVDGAMARLRYEYFGGCDVDCRQDSEMTLATTVKFGRAVTGIDWAPTEINFQHDAPADTTEHRRVFACPVNFSRERIEMVFDSSLLSLPFVEADDALCVVLERHAEEMLARLPRGGNLIEEVRKLLLESLGGGDPGLERIAQQLGLSARTLQRRLKVEGTSHQELLDEMRRDLSKRYLREPQIAICEVAYLLGFSEPSAFHRAFRRWTGTTPAKFKQARA